MSNGAVEHRFLFLGNAVAFGGHIRRPEDFYIDAVASSCLPITGGRAFGSSGKQTIRDIISFESASSSAHGDYVNPAEAVKYTNGNYGDNQLPTVTTVTAQLTGLKLNLPAEEAQAGKAAARRSFEVQQLSASIQTSSSRTKAPTSVAPPHAVISGVTVDGHSLQVRINTDRLLEAERAQKLPMTGTVVEGLSWVQDTAPPGVKINQNALSVEGIGTIYFGEIFVKADFRRLTLIRFQLGSPYGGDATACDVSQNGTSVPPED